MNIDIGIYDTTLIPAIIFILWIVGRSGVQRRFLPLIALVLGIACGLFFIGMTPEGAIAGVLLAASAVGFHSGQKNVIQAIMNTPEDEDDEDASGGQTGTVKPPTDEAAKARQTATRTSDQPNAPPSK